MTNRLSSIALLSVLAVSASAGADTAPAKPAKPTNATEAAAACKTTATYSAKQASKITFKVKNTSKREVRVCWLEFYVYDKAGAQLAHHTLPYNYKIKPGQSDGQDFTFDGLDKEIGTAAVGSIETAISSAKFTDGAEFEDKSLAPDKRPRVATKK